MNTLITIILLLAAGPGLTQTDSVTCEGKADWNFRTALEITVNPALPGNTDARIIDIFTDFHEIFVAWGTLV